jgi:hypothetical protein
MTKTNSFEPDSNQDVPVYLSLQSSTLPTELSKEVMLGHKLKVL